MTLRSQGSDADSPFPLPQTTHEFVKTNPPPPQAKLSGTP